MALFVNEGSVGDCFSPGKYTLTTQNMPIMTTLMNWDKAFKSPFKSEVYFFSTREQIDQRWGTQSPISIRDKEFGVIRLRAFGSFSYQVEEPTTFYQKISGTRQTYSTSELDGQLRAMIITHIATKFGQGEMAFLDLAANQQMFSDQLKASLDLPFMQYGLKLNTFMVQSVTLPEELQEYLDKQSQMNLVGDLKKYANFQAADSIAAAASNPGGLAGAGVGLGAGAAIGQMFAQGMPGQNQSGGAQEDVYVKLEKLHALVEKGVLTQEEFNAKKVELLKSIS
jgi:membrane protease subunit (stomatin/prohibitin family)